MAAASGADDHGLSSALLRTRLSATLRNNGTVDALKTQLRAKVLSELRSCGSAGPGGASKHLRPVVEQAANLLIMDYLQGAGYLYTASVFAPESGVPVTSSASLPDAEFLQETKRVLDLLHIHPDSRLYRKMTSARGSSAFRTLLEFVTQSSDQAPGVTNSACQTTTDQAHTIERKLEQINDRYRGLALENAMAPLKTLEERLAQCQRDADARIRAEVDEAVTRVRKVEMSKMRLEEQARYSQELAQVRAEMESTWQKRLEELRQRESQFNEKLSKKENEAEQQLYAHRQRMLSDMEVVRRRDAESRRQAEDARQQAARQEMRCHELERDLEVKLAHVDKERADLAREREAEMARLRADMLRLRDEEQRELSAQRREVEEQRLQLQISRDSFGDAMAEAKVARDECVELIAENKRLARQLEAAREELQRKGEQCVEKEDECRRLDEETRRLQERVSELEASRRELAGSHFGDSVVDTPHSMRSSRKGGGSPAKSQAGKSLGAMGVVDQLEELRASHGRERVLKEKQLIQSQSELKRAGREIVSLQQRLSEIQREHDLCQARLKESESGLVSCNKELSEVKLQLKMAQQEAKDTRQLLQQSQLALESDRRRAADDEAVKNIFGERVFGARVSPGHDLGNDRFENERQLLASIGPLVSGGAHSQATGAGGGYGGAAPRLDGDGAWELELNRIMTTIGELEQEDQLLRTQRQSLFASQRQERLLRDFPESRPGLSDRPPVTYAWGTGAPEETQRAQVAQLSAPLVSHLHSSDEAVALTVGAAASLPTLSLSLAEEHATAMVSQRAAHGVVLPSALVRQHGSALPAHGAEIHGSAQRILGPPALAEHEQASLLPVRQVPPSPQMHTASTENGGKREMSVEAQRQDHELRQLQEEEKRRAMEEEERVARAAQEEQLRKERELAQKQKLEREQHAQEEREAKERKDREQQREREEKERLAREAEERRDREQHAQEEREAEARRDREQQREEEERAQEEEQRAKREREEETRRKKAEELRLEEEAEREALEKKREELQRQEEEDNRREEMKQEQERLQEEDRKRVEAEMNQEKERVREQEALEQARAKEARDEARAKAREEEELMVQLRRDQEERARQEEEARVERARREREEAQRRREEEEERRRQQEELENSRKQAEEEEQRRAQEEREERAREVKALVQEGTQAIKAGKLDEAQTHYIAAKKASADIASHSELVAQVEALRASLEDAHQNRIKDAVLDLIEDARRELGLQGGKIAGVGRMQVVKARDHIKDCREKMEALVAAVRDELLEEVEELEDEMAAAEDRIAAKEAADHNKEDEAAKAGDMMEVYRQMMQGGGGQEGGSGSSKGGGGSPDRSAGGSIVEDFDFDDKVSGSGSGGGWGQEDSRAGWGQDAEDDDDVW